MKGKGVKRQDMKQILWIFLLWKKLLSDWSLWVFRLYLALIHSDVWLRKEKLKLGKINNQSFFPQMLEKTQCWDPYALPNTQIFKVIRSPGGYFTWGKAAHFCLLFPTWISLVLRGGEVPCLARVHRISLRAVTSLFIWVSLHSQSNPLLRMGSLGGQNITGLEIAFGISVR